MEYSEEKGQCAERTAVIASGSRLTIDTVADFARELLQALSGADEVKVEFPPEIEVDMTALQVFCAACRSAAAQGKRFLHGDSLPGALTMLAEAAGAEGHEDCSINNISCFCRFGGTK